MNSVISEKITSLNKERRRHKRDKLIAKGIIYYPDLKIHFTGVTYDISESGIKIITSIKLETGESYLVAFGRVKLECLAVYEEIRGSSMMDKNVAYYYGMQFKQKISTDLKLKLINLGKKTFGS